MAKKTEKKVEAQEVLQEVENKETTTPKVEEVLKEIEEKIQEGQPDTKVEIKPVVLDEEVQEIADEFKDTTARLNEIVNNNPTNLETALKEELDTVEKAVEVVEKALKEAEAKIPQESRGFMSNIRDFGNWWNGSNSGL